MEKEINLDNIFAVQQTVAAWKSGTRDMGTMNDDEILACFRSVFGYNMITSIHTETITTTEQTKEQRRKELEARRLAAEQEFKEKQPQLSTLFT